ncbi:hypothetical protein WUBG_11109, partial [Wuchereria bancrofti]
QLLSMIIERKGTSFKMQCGKVINDKVEHLLTLTTNLPIKIQILSTYLSAKSKRIGEQVCSHKQGSIHTAIAEFIANPIPVNRLKKAFIMLYMTTISISPNKRVPPNV